MSRLLLTIFAGFAVCATFAQTAGAADFARDVAPIFAQSCKPCHIDQAMGRLSLDSEASILRGGQSGAVVIAGHSQESLLVQRLLGLKDLPRMPMGQPALSAEQIAAVRQWIDQGTFHSNSSTATLRVPSDASTDSSDVFAKQIRPILASRCYACHGPSMQQNGLRLDSLAAIKKGSDYGPVIVPGKSGSSRLIRRLLAQERPMMPYGGPTLSPDQVDAIRKWIDTGAPGPDDQTPIAARPTPKHWAYVKPVRPPVPPVEQRDWVRNPIDNFILAKLESRHMKPTPEAPRPILIRRLYLDLIGLPPSPKEVDEFINDRSPDAYDKVVDRLFASPHYGERWARQWLDLARYADSNGYEKDRIRTAWEYRDWVIRALNSGMSFRDFTIDQIAGDMLPHPTTDQLIATGFNRNSMLNQEGGIDPDEYYYYTLVDRVNTTASVWLGSTLACAQCHNHKFDPFPQKDYYRFLAFFNNEDHHLASKGDQWMQEPDIELPTPEQGRRATALRARIDVLKKQLEDETPQLRKARGTWEEQLRHSRTDWTNLVPASYKSEGGAELKLIDDGSLLATGKNPQADVYVLETSGTKSAVTGVRLEVLPDPSLPNGGPGRDAAGNFVLTDFKVEAAPAGTNAFTSVDWKKAVTDEAQAGYDVKGLLEHDENLHGWAIDDRVKEHYIRQAVFIPAKPLASGVRLRITLSHRMRHATRNIGRFRLSVTGVQKPELVVELPARLRAALNTPEANRKAEDDKQIGSAYLAIAPALDPVRTQISALEKDVKALGIPTAMVMREERNDQRPSAYIRERGTFTSPGELVYADVPSAFNPLPPNTKPNRLALAEWLASDDNPLTARVAVNHTWETIFGRGIVETAEDFGTQSDPPSHQELLDWLATEFMEKSWDMRHIQRLLVTSATYRQDSRVSPEVLAQDPYNRLLSHGPRFRLDAETVHDVALRASGLLSDKMYGPPVFPYQPEGIWNIPYSNDKWVQSQGEEQYRRAVYTFIRRSAPYPSLVTYDAPSREFCTIRRVRTNTPLQALTSLNDPFFFDAARAMAKRVLAEGGPGFDARLNYAFELTMSRQPTKDEAARIRKYYEQQRQSFSKDRTVATKVAGGGDVRNASETASWTMVSNVLLNTDEAITKE